MGTLTIKDSLTDNQARVIGGVLQTSGSGGGGGGSTDLISVGGNPIALGQATSANSLPIVIASDQSPVPVSIGGVSTTQVSRIFYGTQSAVAVGVQTDIVTYTAPSSPTIACLLRISGSGQNVTQWIVDNNGTVFDQQYNTAADLDAEFNYVTGSLIMPGYVIPPGDTVTVSVIQIGLSSANFNARIQVLELG